MSLVPFEPGSASGRSTRIGRLSGLSHLFLRIKGHYGILTLKGVRDAKEETPCHAKRPRAQGTPSVCVTRQESGQRDQSSAYSIVGGRRQESRRNPPVVRG